jgi:hypothetical protein
VGFIPTIACASNGGDEPHPTSFVLAPPSDLSS